MFCRYCDITWALTELKITDSRTQKVSTCLVHLHMQVKFNCFNYTGPSPEWLIQRNERLFLPQRWGHVT